MTIEDNNIEESMDVDYANFLDVNVEDNVIIESNLHISSNRPFKAMDNITIEMNLGTSANSPLNDIKNVILDDICIDHLQESRYNNDEIDFIHR